MHRLLAQPVILYGTILFLMLGIGGGYAYTKISSDHADKDALVQRAQRIATSHDSAEQVAQRLMQARTTAAQELLRLNIFLDQPGSALALAEMRSFVYSDISPSIISVIDAIGAGFESTPVTPGSPAHQRIEELRSKIKKILTDWQGLVSDSTPSTTSTSSGTGSTPADEVAQATEYAEEIKEAIKEIQDILEEIPPGDPGLPDDTDTYVEEITDLITQIEEAIIVLEQPTVPAPIVEEQTEIVIEAEDVVDELEEELEDVLTDDGSNTGGDDTSTDTGGDTSTDTGNQGGGTVVGGGDDGATPYTPVYPNIPGTRYILPPPYIDPTKPKLIEGINPTL